MLEAMNDEATTHWEELVDPSRLRYGVRVESSTPPQHPQTKGLWAADVVMAPATRHGVAPDGPQGQAPG